MKEERLMLAVAKLEIQVAIQGDLINMLIQNGNVLFLDIEMPSIVTDAVRKVKAKYPEIANQLIFKIEFPSFTGQKKAFFDRKVSQYKLTPLQPKDDANLWEDCTEEGQQ